MKLARSTMRDADEDSFKDENDEISENVMSEMGAHQLHPLHQDIKEIKTLEQNEVEKLNQDKLGAAAGIGKKGASLKNAESVVSPKQRAMQDLLEQMHQEIGVPPEKILQAFSEMDEASLNLPPDQTMKQFVAKLSADSNLNPQQTLRASSLYGKFLGDVAQADFDETLEGLAATQSLQDGTLGTAALTKLDESVEDLQRSLKNVGQSPEQLQSEVLRWFS